MAEPSDLKPLVERPAIMFMEMDEASWDAMSKVDQVDYARCALIEALGTWKTTADPATLSARIRTALYLLNDATDGAIHHAAALLPRSNEIFQAREHHRKAAS